MIKPSNVVRHEIIGLHCTVQKSKNDKMMGTVLDETRNTLILSTKAGRKTLIKEKHTFVFQLPDDKTVEVEGKVLVGRPQDRIKKKFDKW